MNKKDYTFVRTVYCIKTNIPASITHHKTEILAELFISICKKYGYDIVSCDIISSNQVPENFIL